MNKILIVLCIMFLWSNVALADDNTGEPLIECDQASYFSKSCDVYFPNEIENVAQFNKFNHLLVKASSFDTITVHIAGLGGSVVDGLAEVSYIQTSKAKVVMDIRGICASMFAIMASSANSVILHPGSELMFHGPGVSGEFGTVMPVPPTDAQSMALRRVLTGLNMFLPSTIDYMLLSPANQVWLVESELAILYRGRGTQVVLGE